MDSDSLKGAVIEAVDYDYDDALRITLKDGRRLIVVGVDHNDDTAGTAAAIWPAGVPFNWGAYWGVAIP